MSSLSRSLLPFKSLTVLSNHSTAVSKTCFSSGRYNRKYSDDVVRRNGSCRDNQFSSKPTSSLIKMEGNDSGRKGGRPIRRVDSACATVVDGGRAVQLLFTSKVIGHLLQDGQRTLTQAATVSNDEQYSSIFHAPWLWSNDPQFIHPTSGQRTRPRSTYYGWKIKSVDIKSSSLKANLPPAPPIGCFHPVGTVYQLQEPSASNCADEERLILHITWENRLFTGKELTSSFDLDWLWQFRYDESELQKRKDATFVSQQSALKRGDILYEVDFSQWLVSREDTILALLHAIFRDGAARIKNAPQFISDYHGNNNGTETLGEVAKSLSGGNVSHGKLYGDLFHVQSAANANNVAYTNIPLPPHQDLAYYESKPGLQLLHCVNNRGVTGGSSTLIDAMAAAEFFKELQQRINLGDLDLYRVLLECEATFIKQRNNADMVYRRPHIEEDSLESVVRVTWSPPFEGPLSIQPSKVEEYYLAYCAFERLLDDSLPSAESLLPSPVSDSMEKELVNYAKNFTWEERLEMGDILIFNNQRMLHGRRGYEISSGNQRNGRHLIGCYTNIDDTLNEYRMLRRRTLALNCQTPYIPLSGNGSSSII